MAVKSVLPSQWNLELQKGKQGADPFIQMVAWHILAGSLVGALEEELAPWRNVLQGQRTY